MGSPGRIESRWLRYWLAVGVVSVAILCHLVGKPMDEPLLYFVGGVVGTYLGQSQLGEVFKRRGGAAKSPPPEE